MSAPIGNWQKAAEILLQNAKQTQEIDKFACFKPVENIMKLALATDSIHQVEWLEAYFTHCPSINRKSEVKAADSRTEGNTLFQRKLYLAAIQKYTEAITHSPTGSDDLSLAYGNRSAASFRLHNYNQCLIDIEEAFNSGFPAGSRHKLEMRKAQCILHIGDRDTAITDELTKEMTAIKTSCVTDSVKPITRFPVEDEIPAPIHGCNSVLVQASGGVDMQYNTEQGRFIVANRDIQAGDTLIVERPFAIILLPDHYTSHCPHCLARLDIVYPCLQCTAVQYCCPECRDAAWDQYHCVECHYLDLLQSVGIAHLSLRIILVAGRCFLQEFLLTRDSPRPPDHMAGLDSGGQYCRNYQTVYDLMTHAGDMTVDDVFQYSQTAVLLLKILQHSGWFGHDADKVAGPNVSDKPSIQTNGVPLQYTQFECSIGSLLLRHMQQLVCNAHAITKLQHNAAGEITHVEETSQVRIASAIYPTASLMNHSCDPSIIASFHRDTLIVRAVKDVSKGGEIFSCYGPYHRRMSWSERQQTLREQYFFTCTCPPCLGGQDTDNIFHSYRCAGCDGSIPDAAPAPPCVNCGATVDLARSRDRASKAQLSFQQGFVLLQQRKIEAATEAMLQCYKVRRSVLYRHNKLLSETEDCLARCYATLGEFKKAATYLKLSIATVELMYDSQSIELANELQKLSEVLISAQDWGQALTVTERAVTLFELHYGKSHDTVKELLLARLQLLEIVQ